MLWLATLAPRILQSLTAPKFKNNINDQVPYTALAQLLDRALGLALLGTCVVVVLSRLRRIPERGGAHALVLVAPWAYLVLRDMFEGRSPKIATLVYGFVVVAVWFARPHLRDLRLLGTLTAFTAVLSIAMGVLLPAKGLYQTTGGSLVQADKQILPWGILIGPASSGNNLGQLLVMGAPTLLLIPRRGLRRAAALITGFTILWSASRSSLGALVAVSVVLLLLRAPGPAMRRLLAWSSSIALAAVVALLPVITRSDQAFTNRGYIWRLSVQAWHTNTVFGLGSTWYSQVAALANNIAGAAFHGHNEAVQLAVTGGTALLVLMSVLTVALVRAVGRWASAGWTYPTAQLAAILVSCTLEVSYGLVDRDLFFPVTVLPAAFILLARESTGPAMQRARGAVVTAPVLSRSTRAGAMRT